MLNPLAYENTRPDGFPVMEALDGWKGEQRHFVPLKHSTVSGTVAGPLALLRLTQVFGYSRSQCDKVLEAAYRFPLPGDAAVRAVTVRFGGVAIMASLQERAAAEKQYKEAKRKGKQAAIATRESADVFTLRLAGIKPDEDITVETDYVQLARAEGSGWSLRVPLTTSPRYTRSDEGGTPEAAGQPLLVMRDPGHRFSLSLRFLAAVAIRSRTHALAVDEEGGSLLATLAAGEVLPDRDLVLEWRPAGEEQRPALRVLGGTAPGDDFTYFLALVAPPASEPLTGVAQEAILLVDHSGSMEGPKWEAADWAVRKFLLGLSEGSAFNLCLFHSSTLWFRQAPVAVSEESVQEALRFLEDRSSGGTELGVALEQATSQERAADVETRHIFIITDAEVSDAARILRLADEESARPDRRRISVLCIDAAPNSYLARELAEHGGGVSRFLTSAPEEDDITTALDAILEDWSQPLLAGLRLEVDSPGVEAQGRGAAGGSGSIDMGDMPRGRAVWVVGRMPAATAPAFRLSSRGASVAAAELTVAAAEVVAALRALFGVRRVQALEHLAGASYDLETVAAQLLALGYDPEARTSHGSKLYAENRRADAYDAVRKLLVSESLYFGVASSATAFVAVRQEEGKPVQGTVLVASALPHGWSDRFATGAAVPAPMVRQARFALRRSTGGLPEAMPLADMAVPPSTYQALSPLAAAEREPELPVDRGYQVVFRGQPAFANGEALLFDSAANPGAVAADATIRWLRLSYPGGAATAVDRGLVLLVFVGDLSEPRARVRLADLLRHERPLNLRRRGNEPVRLVLIDANGAWAASAPTIEVALAV
ncbi:MAG: VIT domain-containing protein [Anaerolineae bacterium]